MVNVITFDEAISDSSRFKKRHLLLGNGFSIACCPGIFSYKSLFEKAKFSSAPRLKNVFDALKTTDFEEVIKALQDASKVISIYGSGASVANNMAKDAKTLKDILIRTIANHHPSNPSEIVNEQFWSCRKFLSHFLGRGNERGKVYSLNYDLLLYWTLMHDEIMPSGDSFVLDADDGFGRDEDTLPEFVNWMGESGAHGQRVHYLHGALHLFDAGPELRKYTWKNTGLPLLEQAQVAMAQNMFPLFVAEGESKQKLSKIKHSAYLYHSYKSFSQQMKSQDDALFIFGHSLASNDDHILKLLIRGKIKKAYIGLYGDKSSSDNQKIIAAANHLKGRRGERYELDISYFGAASAMVWNHKP